MKLELITEKTILALFIVIFGMCAIAFLEMRDTTENSFVNLIIMVVSFYFGSSAYREQKDKFNSTKADDIGGSTPPPGKDEK